MCTASSVSSEAAALLGDQQFEMYTEYKGKRHEDNLINERENFFHKPQVARTIIGMLMIKSTLKFSLLVWWHGWWHRYLRKLWSGIIQALKGL